MPRDRATALRYVAAFAALGMAVFLVLLQTVLTPARAAPLPLFLLFTAIWGFGFVMLLVRPTFGAVGTAAWGVLSAAAAWRTHRAFGPEDVALVGGSLAAAALALAYVFVARRAPRA